MNAIKVLTPILLFCFCWIFQLDAQTVKRKFVNQLDQPITVYVVSEAANGQQTTKQTIEVDGHVGSFRYANLQVGDFIYAEVKGNPNVRTDRIFMNGTRGEHEDILLSPQVPFFELYGNLGNNNQATRFLGISYNLFGVDITKYRPRRVIDGFRPNQIFKGIGNQLQPSATRSYYLQKIEGTILPVGFHYTGADSDQDGLMNTTEYHTENAFKKEWNLSLAAAGKVKGVKPSIDFSYGEEFEKTSNQSYVYYIKQQKNKDFRIDTRLNAAEFDDKFIQRVGRIRTQADADQFVQDFGSHYPTAVIYGGMYSQYTSVSKSEFYEAKRKKLNLKVGIEASKTKPTTETTDKSEFEDQKTIRPGKSKSVGGSIGFSQSESQEMREILSNSNSRYYAIGGSITNSGSGWSASGTQTAIEVELGEITDLIDAKILKSRLTQADLDRYGIKQKVAEAVRKQKAKLKDYENRAERAYEMQVTQIKVTKHIDDADKRGKGFIKARVSGSNVEIPLFDVPNYTGNFNSNWEIHFQDPNERSLANRTWHPFYQRADENGRFPTLTVDFSAEMWDSDHCCGNELAEVKWGQIPTKALVTNQPYTHKLVFKDNDHLVLQDWAIEATIMIRPVDPLSIQRRSATRSASAPIVTNVPRFQPPTITESAFKNATTKGGGPAKLVKFYNKAGVNLAQAQSLAAQMGGKVATSYEVQAAFAQHNLDVYAFGMMADGRFAVPVQKDHSNFKKGPNIGAVGGNQGFFYTVPTTSPKATPVATTTATKTTGVSKGSDGPEFKKTPWLDQDFIRIQNKSNNTLYVHNQWEQVYGGPIQADWFSAQWKFIPYGGLKFIGNFQNRANPNLYLSNNGGKVEVIKDPANLQDGNILWTILPEKDGWLWIGNSAAPNESLYIDNDQLKVGVVKGDLSSALWKVEFGPISGSGIVTPPTFKAPEPVNVALNKPTKQSSTHAGYSSKFAVDGNTKDQKEGAYYAYAHTQRDRNPWWEVDLGANYKISQINIFNVSEFYNKHRMEGLYINVSKTPFVNNWDGVGFASNVFPNTAGEYKGNATGRYVRIYLGKKESLNVSEVQVMGIPE